MDSIGQQLAAARRRRGIDLKEAEEATKIRLRLLDALENDQFDLLPDPVYIKGFIRSYAGYLKIDPKPLVEEYKRIQPPEPEYKTESSVATFHFGQRNSSRGQRPHRFISIPAALLTIVFLMTVFLAYLGYQDTIQSKKLTSRKYVNKDLKRLENSRKRKKTKKHKKANSKTGLYTLKLVTKRNTWIRVRSENKTFFYNYLKAGKSQTFISRKPLEVTAGKGSYVSVYLGERYMGRISATPTIATKVYKK